MSERPILFSGQMVQAIRDGRKTQTRRVIKGAHGRCYLRNDFDCSTPSGIVQNRHGKMGDRLWIKETFFIDHYEYYPRGPLPKTKPPIDDSAILYRADGSCCEQLGECDCEGKGATWRPSIFMPRWASRITLEIVSVRVERLQDISEGDCYAEGIERPKPLNWGSDVTRRDNAVNAYERLWDSINLERACWNSNPWVWVIEFKPV